MQTFLLTLPSATVGWPPLNHAGKFASHLFLGGHFAVAIFVPAAPRIRHRAFCADRGLLLHSHIFFVHLSEFCNSYICQL